MSWLWFREREGGTAERLVHAVDVAVGRSYVITPCGRHFGRTEVEWVSEPRRCSGADAPGEPCAVCVLRVLLTANREVWRGDEK
ncbi:MULTISPECIES: hypothetical protein [unclassified Actinopolyspora]|uniref:hypothetical protein n=1 Tax=unclassified Actinopolyspora TaxID=2639451 RepID=UPI0013F69225|nr:MULTISPECIES: hypothetical protein [unclassified Actinopolyspora]NHD18654.1 hypothetical protein [Actinopolyspora sp. BKK2]NHE78024.1 hypothetical protein [Actinopolyspora sp. BKK1]